ncbi:conserved exported protein of unknown function [Nitrospira sp. KM1]|uniref:hypothetical protein n=1 Tax=Nitrospira sp. KM1 TaxID=1936990 RepID=UPI0013A7B3EC|nr:hypothetical protein [Nitrospira sp. KM1]BCA53141.1 conserved exported protein of unknown function [Nitrospira sp. KM1]
MRGRHVPQIWIGVIAVMLAAFAIPAAAIEIQPSSDQILAALQSGKEAARQHSPPDSFYVRFGAMDDLHPNGFLITKLGALSVMATHMALRGMEPSDPDVTQVLDGKTMLISAVIFGDVPTFAVDSYMVLDQEGHTIKPVTVRFDAQANRSAAWPESPRFKAKVVASFNYADFNPSSATTITVYPANGGEAAFHVDFSKIN